jgi:hypothetical protein
MNYAGSMVVEDEGGTRLQLHEYRGRRFFRRVRNFVLDTGEPVERIDCEIYAVAKTGERLRLVEPM